MKKIVALVLTLMLCVSAMAVAAFAAPQGLTSLTIVGDAIPGVKSWDTTDTAGDMTEVSESVYEITLALKAGTTMQFKFAGNHDWNSGYNLGNPNSDAMVLGTAAELKNDGGSGNMSFTAESDITVKVTVDLNPLANGGNATVLVAAASGSGSTNPPAQKPTTPPATQTPSTNDTYRVVGNAEWMGNWDPASDKGLMTNNGKGVYSVTFKNVAAGDYEMKVTANGTWDKSWGDGANNFGFSVSEACDVTVSFTLNGDTGVINVSGKGVPATSDVSMMAVMVLLVLSTTAAAVMVMNKKKFI